MVSFQFWVKLSLTKIFVQLRSFLGHFCEQVDFSLVKVLMDFGVQIHFVTAKMTAKWLSNWRSFCGHSEMNKVSKMNLTIWMSLRPTKRCSSDRKQQQRGFVFGWPVTVTTQHPDQKTQQLTDGWGALLHWMILSYFLWPNLHSYNSTRESSYLPCSWNINDAKNNQDDAPETYH